MPHNFPKADNVDILLLLEGTYPFVTGGVSSWIYNLVRKLPNYKFGVLFLGSNKDDYDDLKYPIPNNIVHIEDHYLFTEEEPINLKYSSVKSNKFDRVKDTHKEFKGCPHAYNLGEQLRDEFNDPSGVKLRDFLFSQYSWDYITEVYNERCPEISFLDYFWAIRGMHAPLWHIAEFAKRAPKAKVLHSISTGYAGLLGALIHHERKCPYIISEHGIYTKERKIDLLSQWVAKGNNNEHNETQTQQYITDLWIHFFDVLARVSYAATDTTVSLFTAYHNMQIAGGSTEDKAIIIPNGVAWQNTPVVKEKANKERPVIALIGRVVSIKDIKTFIRSMITISQEIPHAEAWIIGPTDEDEDYAEECRQLINVLGLSQHIFIKGEQNIPEIMPQLDLVVLSSISEGLPLVILESFMHGIPVVATDVGACRELIYGRDDTDKAMGQAGEIVPVAHPKEMAETIIEMIRDENKWQISQSVGRERVRRYYTEEQVLQSYTNLYDKALEKWQESDLSYAGS